MTWHHCHRKKKDKKLSLKIKYPIVLFLKQPAYQEITVTPVIKNLITFAYMDILAHAIPKIYSLGKRTQNIFPHQNRLLHSGKKNSHLLS